MSGTFTIWLARMKEHAGSGEELARRMGVSGGHVSKILAGERRPGVETYRGAWRAFPEEREQLLQILFREGEPRHQ